MSGYESSAALCPFYIRENGKRDKVVCEGVDDNSLVQLKFPGEKKCKMYTEKHCYSNYKDCLIYNMLLSKYNT